MLIGVKGAFRREGGACSPALFDKPAAFAPFMIELEAVATAQGGRLGH